MSKKQQTDKPEGLDALPKRFRDYIQSLESRAEAAERVVADAPKDSNVFIDSHDGLRPIGKDVGVRFSLGGHEHVIVNQSSYRRFDRLDHPSIEVRSEFGVLAIAPSCAANIVEILVIK